MNQAKRKRIIVVLGMHRSGTSAIARGLKALGVDLGDHTIPPIPENNEKGFWEDVEINNLDNELLHFIGHDWHTLTPIKESDLEREDLIQLKLRAVQLLREKIENITVFGLKEPRMARLLPFWKIIFENLDLDVGYVIAIRNPLSVADSLNKRDGFELEKSSYLWLGHVVPSMLGSEGCPRVVVDYDRLMTEPEKQLSRVAEALSLPFDASSPSIGEYVKEFLTNDLQHTKFHINDLKFAPGVPLEVVEAYAILDKLAGDKLSNFSVELHDSFARLNKRLSEMRPAFEYMTKRDGKIDRLTQALTERDSQITNLSQALTDNDNQLASLTQAVAERVGQIASLAQAVAERDNQIASLSQTAGERNSQIAGLAQVVAERDNQIVSLNQAVAERDNQITGLNQSVADARRELAQVLASKSWRITKPLRFSRRVAVSKPYITTRRALSGNSRALWRALPISHESKRSLKGMLFNTFPWIFRWSKAYEAWNAFNAPVNYSPMINAADRQPGETGGEYVPLIKASPLEQKPAKLICFYLPQFHAIPENDEWWGEGFTEWTNVQPAQPQFESHYQPHVPGELGYYNLLDPAAQRRQVELAKLYGIEGFCFYFYWFGGKRLLEAPIENYLNDKTLDLPFCLCWANENWSRRWDGLDSEILMAQQHSVEDDLAFIQHVARYMRDPRYIRINGKPLLLVYRPSLLPSAKETASRWRDWCRANGIGEIYLAYTQSFENVDPAKYGFDAAIEFPPNNSAPPNITGSVTPIGEDFGSTVYDWRVFVERSEHYKQQPYTLFRSVCPSWDNTARRKNRGTVFLNSTPTHYQRWLENAIRDTQAHRPNPDERLIFVNAWNEWAEGAHLEPDARYGYAYLQATRDALEAMATEGRRRILLVTHDCHPHGAQFLALEVARQLVRNGFVPAIIALDGGKLQSEFARLGPMLVVSSAGQGALGSFLANSRDQGYSNAITSTVVSGDLLPELKKHGFRVLSLIHELPGVIHGMKQEENAQRIAGLADQIVFPAELVRDQYATIAPLANEKSIIRPQGLLRKNPYQGKSREAHREVCQRHALPFDTRIVLSIGYLDQRKGADLFVEIAAQVCQHLENTVFIWVGHTEQELECKVRKRIEELGLEKRILLVGFDPEPLVYYAAAAVYALTSREDPFPNVVVESASVGVPVVAFEGTTGAAGFIVQQGGLLAHQLDVAHFAMQVEESLSQQEARPTCLLPDLSLQRYVLDLLHYLNGGPRVSVIVPNYNYARLIERRLESIHMQTYPVYELIVLDDASTDDSVTRIEDYCRKSGCDARLDINRVNSGSVFRQWVKGVRLATGDLVWIAEADDIADPNFLSTLVPAFSEKGVALAFCQSRQIDENGCVIANDYLAYTGDISERWRNDHFGDGMDEIREFLSIKNVIPNVSGVLFDRQALLQALEAVGEELFDYRVAGDWLVYLHVLAQGRLYYSAKSLNDHRRHQQSVTSATALENHLAEVAKVQTVAQEIARPDEPVLAQSKEYLERLRVQFGLDNSSIDRSRDAKHHTA